jgi:hypothetical protein
MGQISQIAMTMLWLVALYLILTNYIGTTNILTNVGSTWFSGIKTLQGRD